MVKTLVIRGDATIEIGIGHVMRCLALAQGWQDAGGHVIFVISPGASALEPRLRAEGMEVVHLSAERGSADDASQTVKQAIQRNATWIVVDGYHFGADYQRIVKESGLRLLFLDDHGHSEYYYADFVLNQNLNAHQGLYEAREPYTRLLLGTRYALLRREFLRWMNWERPIPEVGRNVLVTLGGSDPHNFTTRVIEGLQLVEVNHVEASVVVGGNNPYFNEIQSAVRTSRFPMRLQNNVVAMPELMAWADAAIASAGSTSWELVFMRVPSLVVAMSENHRAVAEHLSRTGVSVNLGWHEKISCDDIATAITKVMITAQTRYQIAQKCRSVVDGEGAERALMQIKGERIRLRRVREDDCKLLWEWANDPVTRSVSFRPDPIPWDQHVQWFKSKISDPNCAFFIAVNTEDIPVGQVRHDIDGNEAVISVSMDEKFRGKGYGSIIIQCASQRLFNISHVITIHAYMKQGNDASMRAFMKSGYSKAGETIVGGCEANHLVMRK